VDNCPHFVHLEQLASYLFKAFVYDNRKGLVSGRGTIVIDSIYREFHEIYLSNRFGMITSKELKYWFELKKEHRHFLINEKGKRIHFSEDRNAFNKNRYKHVLN
jgi:hypothetical protein